MEEGSASGTAEMVCFFRALDLQWDKEKSLIKDEYARLFLSEKMQTRLPGYADLAKRDRYRRLEQAADGLWHLRDPRLRQEAPE